MRCGGRRGQGEMAWQWACNGVGVDQGASSLSAFFSFFFFVSCRSLEDRVPQLEIFGSVVWDKIW